MPPRKLNDEQLKAFIELRRQGIPKYKCMEEFGIRDKCYRNSMKRAIDLGYITKEEIHELNKKSVAEHSIKTFIEKHGKKEAKRRWRQAWWNNIGHSHEKIRQAGRAGGLALHGKPSSAAKSVKNLEDRRGKYNASSASFDFNNEVIEFSSKIERYYGVLFVEEGVIDKIRAGENYQVPLEDPDSEDKRKTIHLDFLINNMVIEIHPASKGEENKYYEKRKEEMKKRGYDLELKIATTVADSCDILKLFKPSITEEEYYEIVKKITSKIERYDQEQKKLEDDDDFNPF